MEIQLYIGDDLLKVYSLDDKYLESIPGHSWESMYNMRMNIITSHIEKIKKHNAKLFERLDLSIVIAHQSKMNREDFIIEETIHRIPLKTKAQKAS
jgi:hypothetical protein